MAAVAAGNTVITTASIAYGIGHRERPSTGIVESTAPWVVDWASGIRTSYVAVGSGATSILYQIDPTPTHPSLIGYAVQLTGLPNPGGRVQGVVVAHFDTLDPAGGSPLELVVVETEIGFVTAPYTFVTVVSAA